MQKLGIVQQLESYANEPTIRSITAFREVVPAAWHVAFVRPQGVNLRSGMDRAASAIPSMKALASELRR